MKIEQIIQELKDRFNQSDMAILLLISQVLLL